MDAILVNALRQAVDEWFTRWRTFAEQGDQPPQHWQEIVSAVSSATWQRFDFTTGAWHPINFDE